MHDPVLPKNIIHKISKTNPEEILQNELTKKFGKRFLNYRKNYTLLLNILKLVVQLSEKVEMERHYCLNLTMGLIGKLLIIVLRFLSLGKKCKQ